MSDEQEKKKQAENAKKIFLNKYNQQDNKGNIENIQARKIIDVKKNANKIQFQQQNQLNRQTQSASNLKNMRSTKKSQSFNKSFKRLLSQKQGLNQQNTIYSSQQQNDFEFFDDKKQDSLIDQQQQIIQGIQVVKANNNNGNYYYLQKDKLHQDSKNLWLNELNLCMNVTPFQISSNQQNSANIQHMQRRLFKQTTQKQNKDQNSEFINNQEIGKQQSSIKALKKFQNEEIINKRLQQLQQNDMNFDLQNVQIQDVLKQGKIDLNHLIENGSSHNNNQQQKIQNQIKQIIDNGPIILGQSQIQPQFTVKQQQTQLNKHRVLKSSVQSQLRNSYNNKNQKYESNSQN